MGKSVLREDFYYTCTDGINRIHAVIWKPEDGKVQGIIQIAHGEKGYIKRYDEFARYMANEGYIVVGNDHLGHGQSVKKSRYWGYFAPRNAEDVLINDIYSLTLEIKKKHKEVNYYLMGDGMGSFLARRCLMMYPCEYSGAIIVGTGVQSNIKLNSRRLFLDVMGKVHGQTFRNEFIEKVCFGSYNKKFARSIHKRDWLTKDKNELIKIISEPACNFVFSINGIKTLLDTTKYIQKRENIAHIKRDLPMLIISGDNDPVGDYSKGVKKLYLSYMEHGMNDLTLELRKNDRHYVLSETDRQDVYEYIFNWIRDRNA